MQTTTNISDQLRASATDPMWANHAEVNKATLLKAASAIEVLTRLLKDYVQDDDDTDIEGFDGIDHFPRPYEARKIEAVALLAKLEAS